MMRRRMQVDILACAVALIVLLLGFLSTALADPGGLCCRSYEKGGYRIEICKPCNPNDCRLKFCPDDVVILYCVTEAEPSCDGQEP